MKTYAVTVRHNGAYTQASIELVDVDTLYVAASWQSRPLVNGHTILAEVKEWANARAERPIRVISINYMSSCTWVELKEPVHE